MEGAKDILWEVFMLLVEEGCLSIKDVSVVGTRIEANVNRYTFV